MWSTPRARHVQRVMELERVRVAEVEPVQPLGDDDRVAAVGREVHVVRIVDRDRRARACPVRGSIAVSELPSSFVTYSVFRSHAGTTCCGSAPTREVLDDLERALVDHVDRVAVAVRDVDERPRAARDGAQVAGAVGGVDVRLTRTRRRARATTRVDRHELGQVGDGAVAPRPPASRIPRAVADGREIGERPPQRARRRGSARVAGSTATIRSVGVPVDAPRPPTTNATEPIAAAAACVVGAGRRPMRVTRPVAGSKA